MLGTASAGLDEHCGALVETGSPRQGAGPNQPELDLDSVMLTTMGVEVTRRDLQVAGDEAAPYSRSLVLLHTRWEPPPSCGLCENMHKPGMPADHNLGMF